MSLQSMAGSDMLLLLAAFLVRVNVATHTLFNLDAHNRVPHSVSVVCMPSCAFCWSDSHNKCPHRCAVLCFTPNSSLHASGDHAVA